MSKHRPSLCTLSVALLSALAAWPLQAAAAGSDYGDYGKQTLMGLIRDYPGRYSGADAERRAAAYMQQRMTFAGYDAAPQQQAFTFVARRGPLRGRNVASSNVVLHKSGSGHTGKTLYVGAHYDSFPGRPTLQGLDDNASGAALLTELARNLRGVETEHNLSFVSFGAEEYGLEGAKHFVGQMSATDRQNALGMINMDSLITGDKMYANAGDRAHDAASGQPVPHYAQLREHTHRIARELGIDLHINPGDKEYENTGAPYKPKGVGCCSDQVVFDTAEIPVVGFEATNWDLPDYSGYTQTDNPKIAEGYTWHIPERDNENYLLAALGQERIDQRMRDFSHLVSRLIIEQTNADVLQSMKSAADAQNQASHFIHQQASQDRLAIRQRAEGLRLQATPGGWWLDGRYRYQHADHSGQHHGQLGLYVDHAFTPRWRLGGGVSLKGSNGNGVIDKDRAYGAHAYALYGGDDTPWWNTATLGWHQHRLHLQRHIRLGGGDGPVLLNQQANGKAWARVLSLGNELGYDFIRHERSRHGAYLGLQYQHARIGSHHSGEAGSRTALDIEASRDRRFNSELGYQWQQRLHWGALPLSLSARLGWVREWRRPGIDALRARADADSQMRSVHHPQDAKRHYGQLGLGLQAAVSKNMHSHVHLDTTLGKNARQSAVQLGLQYRF